MSQIYMNFQRAETALGLGKDRKLGVLCRLTNRILVRVELQACTICAVQPSVGVKNS